jgi:Hormone receptor domain
MDRVDHFLHYPMLASKSVWLEQSPDVMEKKSAVDKTLVDNTLGLDELMALNITNENELDCVFNFLHESYPPAKFENISSFCNSTWDGVSCWPTTAAGSTSFLPCVDELNGIKYDTTRKFSFNPITLLFCTSGFVSALR